MISYNIKFPLNDDNDRNSFFKMTRITKEAFSSDLLLLLLTQKGERYYEPEYGTNLLKFIFEPNDTLTGNEIEKDIKKTVSLYIPALTINSVSFSKSDDNEHQINVIIRFTYSEDAFSESGEVELNF